MLLMLYRGYSTSSPPSPYAVEIDKYLQGNIPMTDNRTEIWMLGMFPMTGGWYGGQGIFPAIEMALDDINGRQTVIPGYQLRLVWGDTKVGSTFLYNYMKRKILG